MKQNDDEPQPIDQLYDLACRGVAIAERAGFVIIAWFFGMARDELGRLLGVAPTKNGRSKLQ